MVDTLTTKQERAQLLQTWKQVFASNNPFGDPFREDWNVLLFYPTYGYHFEEHQYDALMAAVLQSGAGEALILESELESKSFEAAQSWRMTPDTQYAEYCEIGIRVENSIWSPSGKWGGMISHELHAIIGGEPDFIKTLLSTAPFAQQEQDELLKFWEDNSDVEWLHNIIARRGIL